MASGIARSRGSTVIIRTRSCHPQPVAPLSSMLASFSGSLFPGGFKKASVTPDLEPILSAPSGKRAPPSQMFQHKPKNDVSLLGLESGELITLVSRSNAVLDQVSCKSISGSSEVDNLHLKLTN